MEEVAVSSVSMLTSRKSQRAATPCSQFKLGNLSPKRAGGVERVVGYDWLAPSLGKSALNSFLVIPVAAAF